MKGGHDDDRLFSYRTGIRQEKEIQVESMDPDLRNRIWNAVYEFCLGQADYFLEDQRGRATDSMSRDDIISKIFDGFFEDASVYHYVKEVKGKFYDLEWYEVYNFAEFVLRNFPLVNGDFRGRLNRVLKEEFAGYRFVGDKITPITNELEIDEVAKAQHTGISEIDRHMESAISLLSDRNNPDPRNAAKEAISAVEALCKKITGDSNADLRKALREIKKRNPKLVDPHLGKAMDELYSFSSEASGVRHAHAEGKTQVGFDEAKFMVVACSAIVNCLAKHAAPK